MTFLATKNHLFQGNGLIYLNDNQKWKEEPLLIPDFDENKWFRTHPLEQIRWTREKNQLCNGYYVNVVKAIKWWKKLELPNLKHPKSYPLEHFIGECCPNGINSVAEGIAKTFQNIVQHYSQKPFLPDRGVPEHDVFETLSEEDYKEFYEAVCRCAPTAQRAFACDNTELSVTLWRSFFKNCEEFPTYNGTPGGFTPRKRKSEYVPTGRFG